MNQASKFDARRVGLEKEKHLPRFLTALERANGDTVGLNSAT